MKRQIKLNTLMRDTTASIMIIEMFLLSLALYLASELLTDQTSAVVRTVINGIGPGVVLDTASSTSIASRTCMTALLLAVTQPTTSLPRMQESMDDKFVKGTTVLVPGLVN